MSLNFEDVEATTKTKCLECGDTLAPFEINFCIICETLAE